MTDVRRHQHLVKVVARKREEGGKCEWFALCENPATTTEPHPILGAVPICERCERLVMENR